MRTLSKWLTLGVVEAWMCVTLAIWRIWIRAEHLFSTKRLHVLNHKCPYVPSKYIDLFRSGFVVFVEFILFWDGPGFWEHGPLSVLVFCSWNGCFLVLPSMWRQIDIVRINPDPSALLSCLAPLPRRRWLTLSRTWRRSSGPSSSLFFMFPNLRRFCLHVSSASEYQHLKNISSLHRYLCFYCICFLLHVQYLSNLW